MSTFAHKFGPPFLNPEGYVMVSENSSGFQHKFGGTSWKVIDRMPIADGPALLFVLDLSDPKLSVLNISSSKELPICSYINSDVWLYEQTFRINYRAKEIELISKNTGCTSILSDDDRMPNPLPEKLVDLRKMDDSEYPIDEDSYWENTDDFLGGQSFFRVAGNPLWLQDPQRVICSCGAEANHIMSIGYEGWGGSFQYIENMPFF